MIMIVAPWCARSLCFLVLWNISIALIHGNKHQNFVISLVISSQVMKTDFLYSWLPALPVKLSKIFCLYSVQSPFAWKTPYFCGQPDNTNSSYIPKQNPIITDSRCYAWSLSHGLEVVRIERVVLPYIDLEAGRTQLMWTLSSAPTWEIGFYYYYYYYYYYYCCCCCCC